MIQRKAVRSSNLKSVGHDPLSDVLEVEFDKGGVYRYLRFTAGDFVIWMNSTSLGSALHDSIKPNFRCLKMDGSILFKEGEAIVNRAVDLGKRTDLSASEFNELVDKCVSDFLELGYTKNEFASFCLERANPALSKEVSEFEKVIIEENQLKEATQEEDATNAVLKKSSRKTSKKSDLKRGNTPDQEEPGY